MTRVECREAALISRVLIIGHGSIGKRHLRLVRRLLPNAEIWVLRHKISIDIPEYSDGCFFNIDEAITFAPQIAIITNPATYHCEVAKILASKGVHLLVEKPLAASLDGISELLSICRQNNTALVTGYNLRFKSSLQRYRDFIRDNIIGNVLSFRCESGQNLKSWRPGSDYRTSVSANHELGGGVLLELSHEIDYLRWIFGEVSEVKATLSRQSNLDINVEDTAHLTITFERAYSGIQLIGTVNLDFIRCDTTRTCIAIGENGSLRWDGIKGKISLFSSNHKKWQELEKYSCHPDDSYFSELRNFISCVNGDESPMVTGEDGLRVLEIIEAARQSAKAGGQSIKVKRL